MQLQRPAAHPSAAPSPAPALRLQRQCACGTSAGLAGGCPACARKKGLGLQPRLAVGPADDAYEREADRVAQQIEAGPVAAAVGGRATPRIQRMSAAPHADADAAASASQAGSAPPLVGEAIAGVGRPLEASLRTRLEPRLGHDLGRIRIHTGAQSARAAAAIGARAYTVGHDIAFGAGQYAPDSAGGRRLLAHELTHAVQQGAQGTLVQRDLIYGSGYPNPFAGQPATEAAAAQKSPREWFPSSVDFAETASLSGGGRGQSTLAGLLDDIRGKAPGAITDLGLVGHADADRFALGGVITRKTVSAGKGATLGATQLAAVQPGIDAVRDRFASGAHITLYGCNSGASGSLLRAISMAFKICARGFKSPITWCLGWSTAPLAINSRGRTLINPTDSTPCEDYNGSLSSLTPDAEDCSGTRPKAPEVELPPRQPRVPQVPQ